MGYHRRQKAARRQAESLGLFDRTAEIMSRRTEDGEFGSSVDFTAASGVVKEAKKIFTEHSPFESELVLKAMFMPDRRLPNELQDLNALTLAQARAKFLGKVAQNPVEPTYDQSTSAEEQLTP